MTLGEAAERTGHARNGASQPEMSVNGGRRLAGRRRAIPSGRAVLGGLLIAGAAVAVAGAALAGNNQRGTGTFVVAAHPLQAGALIEPGDLATVSVRVPRAESAEMYESTASLSGRTVAVPVARGELLQTSMLVPAGQASSLRPVTVGVDPASLAGLYPGEPVDVLQTTGADTSSAVTVVIRGAILFSISRPDSGAFSGPASATVTLGVGSLDEVESVVGAAHAGTLTIVAATPQDGVGPGPAAGTESGAGAGSATGQ